MAEDEVKRALRGRKRRRPILRWTVVLTFLGALGWGAHQALLHPQTPLPAAWNPAQPLRVADSVTPITAWKLRRAVSDIDACLAALDSAAAFARREDFEHNEQCHIRGRINLSGVGDASIGALDTRCAIGLRMAMWERHSLQPAARDLLDSDVSRIAQIGSYNCRALRTTAGNTSRMSTHATANAIDIAGFTFSDGQQITLLNDWDTGGAKAEFLRRARDGACDWFNLTLSPDYNVLHADHFHLQSTGWGLCR